MTAIYERARLLAMSETVAKNVLEQHPQLANLTSLIKTLVKDVFLVGLIQGGFKRNVNIEQVFEFLVI